MEFRRLRRDFAALHSRRPRRWPLRSCLRLGTSVAMPVMAVAIRAGCSSGGGRFMLRPPCPRFVALGLQFVPVDDVRPVFAGIGIKQLDRIGEQEAEPLDGCDRLACGNGNGSVQLCLLHQNAPVVGK